ncbi:hypothetical protein EV714DRAFT_274000 [Schizophyllum commune]
MVANRRSSRLSKPNEAATMDSPVATPAAEASADTARVASVSSPDDQQTAAQRKKATAAEKKAAKAVADAAKKAAKAAALAEKQAAKEAAIAAKKRIEAEKRDVARALAAPPSAPAAQPSASNSSLFGDDLESASQLHAVPQGSAVASVHNEVDVAALAATIASLKAQLVTQQAVNSPTLAPIDLVPTPVPSAQLVAPTSVPSIPAPPLASVSAPTEVITVIVKPEGEAGNNKTGYRLISAMGLDHSVESRRDFRRYQRTVHINCAKYGIDMTQPYRHQDAEVLGKVFKAGWKAHPYLTPNRFPCNWAQAAMVKQYIRNHRKYTKCREGSPRALDEAPAPSTAGPSRHARTKYRATRAVRRYLTTLLQGAGSLVRCLFCCGA